MSFPTELLESAHGHATNNRVALNASAFAGCFYCLETYPAARVDRWLNEGEGTACCPECTIDSVLGDASGLPVADPEFLRAMHEVWFTAKTGPISLEGSVG